MNTTMKTKREYTMSAMGLVNAPDAVITAEFRGQKLYHGPVSGLAAWCRENNALHVVSCVSEGMKHGLFPCIVATNERVSGALSALSGYPVAVGDGRSFWDRGSCLDTYRTLVRSGVPIAPDALCWAITDLPYGEVATPKQAAAKAAQQQLQLEECPI